MMVPMVLAAAASVQVALELGAGQASGARRAACVAVATALASQAALAGLVSLAGPARALSLFSGNGAVKSVASDAFAFMLASTLPAAASCVLSGVLRGSWRALLGAGINAAGYWLVGAPLCLALAPRLGALRGLPGLWLAVGAVSACVALAQALAVARLDWRAEVGRVANRAAGLDRAAALEEASASGGGGGNAASSGASAGAAGAKGDMAPQDETGGSDGAV
jgi:multidrug resistance protein, MATE family